MMKSSRPCCLSRMPMPRPPKPAPMMTTSWWGTAGVVVIVPRGVGGSVFVGSQGHAAAEEVAVAVDVVHAAHRRPVLLQAQRFERISRFFARVGMCPVVL